jgi:Cys-rich four helix bundle protein (predicted Tat secretion target)
MKRNEFLWKTGATIASISMAGNIFAQDKKDHSHHKGMKAGTGKWGKVKMSAIHCILVAEDCLSHCLVELGNGDTSLAGCANSTRDVISACKAFLSLASQESKFTKKMGALCAEICSSCAEECKKHADRHEVCKACMNSCNDCAKEMKKV